MSDPVAVVTRPLAVLVARNAAALGIGELLSRLIAFTATIYVARTLGVEAYAIIGVGMAVLLYATTLVDAGIEHTGPREVAMTDRLPDLLASVMIARVAWSCVVALLMLAATLVAFTGTERLVLLLFALALLPAGLNTRWLHIGRQRAGLVSVSRVAAEAVRAAAILLLVHGPEDLIIVPVAQLAGDLTGALILLGGVRATGVRVVLRFDAELVAGVARRALPMAVSALLAVMIYNVDVLFLRAFRSRPEVGLYLAGYTLLNFLGVLGHVTALTLVPAFTRLRSAPAALTALFRLSAARVLAIGLPMAVGGSITASLLILLVFGPAFAESSDVLAILVWVLPVLLLRSVGQALLIAEGRQDMVLRSTVLSAVANVGLNTVAVPLYGMYGAAVTTVMAEVLRLIAVLVYLRRNGSPVPQPGRLVHGAAAAAAMGGVLLAVRPATLLTAVPLGVSAWLLALLLTGAYRQLFPPEQPQDDAAEDEYRHG